MSNKSKAGEDENGKNEVEISRRNRIRGWAKSRQEICREKGWSGGLRGWIERRKEKRREENCGGGVRGWKRRLQEKGAACGRRVGGWFRDRQKRKEKNRREKKRQGSSRFEDAKSRWKKRKKALQDRFAGLKWRFGLYVPLCIILAFAGSFLIGVVTNYLQDWCVAQYADIDPDEVEYYYEMWYDENGTLIGDYVGRVEPESLDTINSAVALFQFFLIPGWILFSAALTGKIFYNRELRTPINLLLNASKRIADNELDFRLEYDKPNEFGMLCGAFDEMRSALYDSNRQLWRSLEERKRLNAAFSHDLRTPLTVLRGYADFLEKYVPGGNISEKKLLEVLGMMNGQIVRLEHYTQTMNSVQKLGDIVPNPQPIAAERLKHSFFETGRLLCSGKQFALEWQGEGVLQLDEELVFQIYENLISNACRYAADCVSVSCVVWGGCLRLTVSDDGGGFSAEALRSAADPFFRDEKEPDKTHFGLGLYICRILCEKCGGTLKIENDGGGRVTAAVLCGD
ncbi:MAG: HAMP domain-containing histidine kinase [Lachnospiraceae bacterium]|nr:HAMP domain-containing histidine kinase [Lachnospiraceae bacterium]